MLALLPMTWAWLSSSGHRVTADHSSRWMAAVPHAPVALVLGAGLYAGQPTLMLARRLDVAAELYRAGRVRVLLLSGDHGRVGYDEPTAMRDYLVARGVPARMMVLDYAGFDTWDSCVRARKVFGVSKLTVVTQDFHLPRAVTLCRQAGIDAFGVGDESMSRWGPVTVVPLALREFGATAKAFLDSVVLDSSPRFDGPRETSVERLLAS
ncbi:ElyC/SanA/YdcF family protein [Thermopolyspora sp. NPDC052614]|uniref:SanA/YdcF family protein n=1 Tax=Thermopolyspora sp. NPDC052614 TaxID=3155682 RepID=UPI003423D449